MAENHISTACILVIGNEILSGKTLDTNSQFLSSNLFNRGIDVMRRVTVPDHMEMMVEEIRVNSKKYDYLFSMGGIGSTPDDLTRQAFAIAFDVPLVRNPEAERMLLEFNPDKTNEARLRMADLPEGCSLIKNPYFGASGFYIRNCFVLPGIPELLVAMYDEIKDLLPESDRFQFKLKVNVPESRFTPIMEQLDQEFPQVEIGSYPAFKNPEYKSELTFTGRDKAQTESAFEKFKLLIEGLEEKS